jgi:type II secretory pathway component PulF
MSPALKSSDKLTIISNLSVMLTAGIPILEIVELLIEDVKGVQKRILETLKKDLKAGQPISVTLAKFPKSFDPIEVNLVKAGEESGSLDTTLNNLTESIKKDIEMSNKIKAAIAYPLLVVFVFFVVVIFILIFVVPKISQVFQKLHTSLPLPTKILIKFSEAIIFYGPFFTISAILLIIFTIIIFKSKSRIILKLIFMLPVISGLGKYIDLTRFNRNLSLQLSSGIPIVRALELSSHIVVKREMVKTVKNCQQAVLAGQQLSTGLKKEKGAVPQMMIRLISAGEKSGSLEKSLSQIADYYDNQVTTTLKLVAELIEPILLVVIGLLVGGAMLAIVAPIYQLVGQIKIR